MRWNKLLLLLPPSIRWFSVILSFVLPFCKQDNWRKRKRTSTKLNMGKRWPSRSGWLLVVIRICAWIPVFHFLHHWGIGDFPTFVSISVFSVLIQSTADLNQTWRNKWRRRMYPRFWNGYLTDIRIQINPKIRVRIRINCVSNFGVGRGLHSLLQTKHL